MSFALEKKLSVLLVVALSVCATGIIFKKWSPVPYGYFPLSVLSCSVTWIYGEDFDPLGLEFCPS